MVKKYCLVPKVLNSYKRLTFEVQKDRSGKRPPQLIPVRVTADRLIRAEVCEFGYRLDLSQLSRWPTVDLGGMVLEIKLKDQERPVWLVKELIQPHCLQHQGVAKYSSAGQMLHPELRHDASAFKSIFQHVDALQLPWYHRPLYVATRADGIMKLGVY